MMLAPYLLLLVLAACTAAALAVRAAAYATPVAKSFALAMLGLVVWTAASGLGLAAGDLASRAWWYGVEWVGFVLVPSAWLLFALQFATAGSTRRAALLAVPGLVFLVLAWTNPLHGLMWHALAIDTAPLPTLDVERAPGYWAYTAYAYAQVAAAVCLLVRALWRLGHLYRQQGLSLLVGTSVPLVTNLAYNLQLGPIPNLELTPVAFTITGVMLGWGLLRLRLLDLVPVAAPVAHRAIVEGMADGVLVLDREAMVVDANPAVEGMLSRRRPDLVGQRLDAIFEAQAGHAEATGEAVVDGPSGRHYYDVRHSSLRQPNGELAGQLVVLRDVTERRRSHEVLATLQAVSTEVAAALDPVSLAELAVRELHERFGYELPSVYFLEADGKLHMAAQIGYTDPVLEFEPNTGVIGRVARTLQSALIRDASADPDFVLATDGVVGEVCVPIVGDGQLRGMINVEARRAGVLTEEDVTLLELLAQMMAVSLRNADLYAAARRRGDELLALQRTSAEVATLREPQELAELVVSELRDRFGYPLSSIYFLDARGRARLAACGGYPDAIRRSFDPSTGVIGRALRTGRPELVLEPERDAEFVDVMPGVCAQVCVPMVAEGRVLGVLSAESTTPGQLGPRDLELLGLLARQMAVALENTRLYEAAQAEWVERARAEAKYRTLFEESRDVLFITTPEGRILDINPAGVELFGYLNRDELLRVSALELWVDPAERAAFARQLEHDGFVQDFPFELKARDGRRLSVLETATVERDGSGRIVAYRGILRDVTERVERLARERAETARRGAILRAARRFAQARDGSAVLHELLAEAVRLVEADDASIARWDSTREALVQAATWRPSDGDGTRPGLEATVPLQQDDQTVGRLTVCRPRPFLPEELEALELLASFAAATLAGLEHTQALRQQAERDSLTGLANRQHGTVALDNLLRLAQRQQQRVTVVVLDLDHFKSVNDLHGHPAGDRVLERLGDLLRSSFRDSDVVARWGGEEFVIGAFGADEDEGLRRTEEVRERLAAEVFEGFDGRPFSVTISAGLATWPTHGHTLQSLYEAADAALYRAKATGRNRVAVAAPQARAA